MKTAKKKKPTSTKQPKTRRSKELKLPHPTYTFPPKQLNEVIDEMWISYKEYFLNPNPDELGWELSSELKGLDHEAVLFRLYRTPKTTPMVLLGEPTADANNRYGGTSDPSCIDPTDRTSLIRFRQIEKARKWASISLNCVIAHTHKDDECMHNDLVFRIGLKTISLLTEDTKDVGASQDPSQTAKEAGAAYQSGLLQNPTMGGRLASRGRKPIFGMKGSPREIVAIWRTAAFVRIFERLPTKTWLRSQLESEGMKYAAEKGRDGAKWNALFSRSGLESLAD